MGELIWYVIQQAGQLELLDGVWMGLDEQAPDGALVVGNAGGVAYAHPTRWSIDVYTNPPHRVVAVYRLRHGIWEYGRAVTTITVTQRWPRARPILPAHLLHAPALATRMAQAWLDWNNIVFPFEPRRVAILPQTPEGDIAAADGACWSIVIRARPHAFCDCRACMRAAPRHEIVRWFRHRFRSWTRTRKVEVTQ